MSKKKNSHKSSFLTDPLTRKRFKKELRAATRSQFRPLNRELQKQTRINKLQAQNTSRWFNTYQQQIGRMKQDSAASYGQAGQAMNNYAAAAGSRNAALMNELNAQNARNAQLYGQQANPAAANYALQSGAMNAQMGGDMAGAIQAQGANTNAYFGGLGANAKLGRIEALSALRANRQQISQDKRDLIREKADFRNQYLADAREGERRFYLANKELRNSNQQAAKDRKLTRGENRKDRQQGRRDTTSKDGNAKERKQAMQKAAALLGAYDRKDVAKDPGKFIAALANKGIPANIARRAVRQALKGGGGGKGHKGGKGFDWGSVWGK